VCRPRAHSCPGSTAVGITLVCARSASSFFHGEVTTFGFISRSERSRSGAAADVGRSEAGCGLVQRVYPVAPPVSAARPSSNPRERGAVAERQRQLVDRRSTLSNGSRDIRHWPGLDAGVGGAGLAIEPQCDSSVYGPPAAGDATTIPVILPGHPCLPIAVLCVIPYSRLGGQRPWFRHGGRSDAQQAFDTVSHRLASHC